MKKAAFLLAFILIVSSGFSQQKEKAPQENQMTPKQRTTLAVKKLTLALDLDTNQIEKVTTLFTQMSKKKMVKGQKVRKERMVKREKMMKIRKEIQEGKLKREDVAKMRKRRKDSNFDTQNNALDHLISMQNEMKKILTKEQFTTYKKIQKHKVKKRKKIMRIKKSH
jgi:hypothetical protein